MGRQHHLGIAIAALLIGAAPAAGQAPDPEAEEEAVEDALEEPADPDDEMDIRADNDPDDVGQEALEPEAAEHPSADIPRAER